MLSSKRSSQPKDRTCVSCIADQFFTAQPLGKPQETVGFFSIRRKYICVYICLFICICVSFIKHHQVLICLFDLFPSFSQLQKKRGKSAPLPHADILESSHPFSFAMGYFSLRCLLTNTKGIFSWEDLHLNWNLLRVSMPSKL